MDHQAPAPIALFAYNRPAHTRRTVEALLNNPLAAESELFVFSDGPKNDMATAAVAEVREYLRGIEGFKSVSIVERTENLGLANSIIGGVGTLCERYGRAIVLEDDILASPGFLNFMNQALARYESEPAVWHISGWNYPMASDGLAEAFFWRMMNCWGWATWRDRWQAFEKNPAALVARHSHDARWIHRFNIDGATDAWSQVVANHEGRLNTWAIFWAATIFEHGGLCLNPTTSFVTNIGHDGSGENCLVTDSFSGDVRSSDMREWPDTCSENAAAVTRIRAFLHPQPPGVWQRLMRRIAAGASRTGHANF